MNAIGLYLIIALITVNSFDVCASLPHSDNGTVAAGREISGEPYDCKAANKKYIEAESANQCKLDSSPGQGNIQDNLKFTCTGKGKNAVIKSAEIKINRDPKSNKPQSCEITFSHEKDGMLITFTRKLDENGRCIETNKQSLDSKSKSKTNTVKGEEVYCGLKNTAVVVTGDEDKNGNNGNKPKNGKRCEQHYLVNGKHNKQIACDQIEKFIADTDKKKKFLEYREDLNPIAGGPERPIRVVEKPRNVGI